MHPILFLVAAAGPAPASDETIIVTASREPVAEESAPASANLAERETLEALGTSAASDVLRLLPGASVSVSGPRGSHAQLRIRGAEANHSLLFVDGIRFNDPAAGNEPRFELLTTDALSRVELVRGPQSALWGSEAIGGVVAVETADPRRDRGASALAEYGSHDSLRASGQLAAQAGAVGLSASAGWQRSDGSDSFSGGPFERDGFGSRSASLKAVVEPVKGAELGLVGHWIEGESEFDGFDSVTFRRADTLDETRNRIAAVRGWGSLQAGTWSLSADLGWLGSTNRNRLGPTPLNRTSAQRMSAGAQIGRRLGGHSLTAAVEHEAEDFRARDQSFFGATDQDRSRSLVAIVGEWRAEWAPVLTTDVAVRHDGFSAFADATTLRASALLRPGGGWRLHAAYGEGIAQPSFYDLYGFFPGSFVGNPALKPERSAGWEAGIGWNEERFSVSATGFSQQLEDEIVDLFDPLTFLSTTGNAAGNSRRKGVELEAEYRPSDVLSFVFNYTFLDAEERQAAGTAAIREIRRPKHSANLVATGRSGRFGWGGSLAYVGDRRDTDFEVFPARSVALDDYLLASLNLSYRLGRGLEAYARVENGFNAHYEDVFGYRTAGRAAYAGLRLRLDP